MKSTHSARGDDLDLNSDDGSASDSEDDMPRFFYGRTSAPDSPDSPDSPDIGNQRLSDVARHNNGMFTE